MKLFASLPIVASIASWAMVGVFLLAATRGSSWAMAAAGLLGVVAIGLEIHLIRCKLADARGQK
jgi:hypothetical protein